MPFRHESPVLHIRMAQQGCPSPPQVLQVDDAPLPLHAKVLPLQVRLVPPPPEAPPAPLAGWQQGCPSAPQALVHIEAVPASPPPAHPRLAWQDIPPPNPLPSQHGSPAAPHFMQAPVTIDPVVTQPSPVVQDAPKPPLQHGSPLPPHFMQAAVPIASVATQPRPL